MDKPDVDSIEGLSPAISIDQKTTSRNPRSTVGTVTEIYDYLRLLWARIGKPHCYNCGEPIAGQSLEQITDRVLTLAEGTRFMVLAPVVRERKGEYGRMLEEMRGQGYARAVIDGELRRLDEEIVLDKKFKHDISIVVDRLVMKEGIRKRLAESIEAASQLAEGLVEVEILDGEASTPTNGAPGVQVLSGPSAGKRGETLLFSEKFACLNCGASMPELEPRIFSFNSPHGACTRCHGLGFQRIIDPDLIVPDPSLSIADGALQPFTSSASRYYRRLMETVAEAYDIDIDTPWQDLPDADRNVILEGTGDERHTVSYKNRYGRRRSYRVRFEGILHGLERRYENTDSENTREKIEKSMALRPCPECDGARLRPESRSVQVGGLGIHEYSALSAKSALEWVRELEMTETERAIARLVVREIEERLSFLDAVGIGYLSLDRAATTLSGGEAQRIRLATQIGSSLVGVLYILDEPSIGLHQRDNEKLIGTLERLRDLGNTVIVVEHDEGTIRAADHVVDLGPGAGEHGGHIVAEGTPKQIERMAESLTGQYLAGKRAIPTPDERRTQARRDRRPRPAPAQPQGRGRRLPARASSPASPASRARASPPSSTRSSSAPSATACTAPGSGRDPTTASTASSRSTRSSTSTSRRSAARRAPTRRPTPASSTTSASSSPRRRSRGRAATSRAASASTSRAGAARSARATARSRSRCTSSPTSTCHASSATAAATTARRSRSASRASNIADVLEMSVGEAVEFFAHIPKIHRRLQTLHDVGLDYIRLGQPATTLSGGEAQRVKLATELSKVATGDTLYILDEPTTGLHFADVQRLLEVLGRLVENGNTVVVIEHNLDVIKSADHLIDLGPEGGEGGGEVVATGTPEQVAGVPDSHTGRFLAELVEPEAPKVRRTRSKAKRREPVAA